MQFTDKEIELAKQVKEVGLEWTPMFGDVVLYHTDIMVVWYSAGKFIVCIPQAVERGVDGKGEYIHQSHYNLVPDDVIWLPLWHQCRNILKQHSIELTVSDVPAGTTITLWKRLPIGGIEFYHQIVADSDLEAMYRAILEVFHMPANSLNE